MKLQHGRRWIAVFLVLSFTVASPLFAQTPTEGLGPSIDRAAKALAAQPQRPAARGDNPYLIPGVVLIGAGGTVLLYGLVHDTGVSCDATLLSVNCETTKSKGTIIAGAAIAGVGAILLMRGERDRSRSPELVFRPGGVMVRERLRW